MVDENFNVESRSLPSRPARVRAMVMALQRGILLDPAPFDVLARSLGATGDEILAVARRMLEEGSARRFGAVFDARRLGYRSELCALDVPAESLERIGAAVAAQEGVTHAYLRGQPPGQPVDPVPPGVAPAPNLWFTLAVPGDRFEGAFSRMEAAVAPFPIRRFPAVRRFKIDLLFDGDRRDIGEKVPGSPDNVPPPAEAGVEALTESDRVIVRALQGNVPVRADFYSPVAAGLGLSEEALLARLRQWHESGTLRRIGLVIRHRRHGLDANAMCVWPVAEAAVVEAGRRLAAWSAVTHCYERKAGPGWPYTLYAMIHTADWESTRRLFERISADAGLSQGRLLGSLREFKKTGMRYFGERGRDADG